MSKSSVIAVLLLVLVAGAIWYLHTPGRFPGAGNITVLPNGNVGIGTDHPMATLEVAGAIRLSRQSAEGCSATTTGEIAYNPDNKHFWGCDGEYWNQLDNN